MGVWQPTCSTIGCEEWRYGGVASYLLYDCLWRIELWGSGILPALRLAVRNGGMGEWHPTCSTIGCEEWRYGGVASYLLYDWLWGMEVWGSGILPALRLAVKNWVMGEWHPTCSTIGCEELSYGGVASYLLHDWLWRMGVCGCGILPAPWLAVKDGGMGEWHPTCSMIGYEGWRSEGVASYLLHDWLWSMESGEWHPTCSMIGCEGWGCGILPAPWLAVKDGGMGVWHPTCSMIGCEVWRYGGVASYLLHDWLWRMEVWGCGILPAPWLAMHGGMGVWHPTCSMIGCEGWGCGILPAPWLAMHGGMGVWHPTCSMIGCEGWGCGSIPAS